MACARYQSWVTDASLDALPPQRAAELSMHLETCPACCEEIERVRALVAKIDRALEGSVAEEPLPEFYAHVRARLAERAAQARPVFGSWAPIAAGVLAGAAFVTLLMFRQAAPGRRAQSSIAQRGQETLHHALSLPTEPAVSRTSAAARRKFHPRANSRLQANRMPEVLIDPSEEEALRRFAAALSRPGVDGALLVEAQGTPPAPLAIERLRVEPVEVRTLGGEAGPKADGGTM